MEANTKVRPPPSLFSENEDLRTFSLYNLFQEILNSSINTLVDFQEKLEDFSDLEKKKILFTFFASTREKLLRILVLIRFLRKTNHADYFQDVGSQIKIFLRTYNEAADSFFTSLSDVGGLRERKFDVDTAVQVYSTGTYSLPEYIKFMETAEVDEEKKKIVCQRINDFINIRLLKERLPNSIVVDRSKDGKIKLIHLKEYKVTLTLDKNFRWKILDVKLLVNEIGFTASPVGFGIIQKMKFLITKIFNSKRYENRYLTRMDEILHDLCVKLAMDIISSQAKHLDKEVYRGIIKAETPYLESQDKFSVRLLYWKVNPKHFTGNESSHHLFTPLETHQGVLSVFINEEKELQVEHHPSLHDGRMIKCPKLFDLDKIDMGMLWQEYIFQFIVSRLNVLLGFITQGKYYNGENVFLHLGPGKPVIVIDIFEVWKVTIGIDWKTGEWFILFLHHGVEVKPSDVQGLNHSSYLQKLYEELSTISKSLFEIKLLLMMSGYEKAALYLGLRYYDEKRVLRFLKNMGHYVAKRLRERKCLYVPFPKIPDSFNYLVLYPNISERNQKFSLHIKASLLLYQGKKMTLIDLPNGPFFNNNNNNNKILPQLEEVGSSRKRDFSDVKSYQDEQIETKIIEPEDDEISSNSETKRLKKYQEDDDTPAFSALSHLRYLLATHRHLVMRNLLFQELIRRFPVFQVRGPDRVSFSYRLRIGGRMSLLLIVLPSGIWEVKCKFLKLSFEGIDISVMQNFRILKDNKEKEEIIAVFSYPEDALWKKFVGDLASLDRTVYIHYQFHGKPLISTDQESNKKIKMKDEEEEEEEGEGEREQEQQENNNNNNNNKLKNYVCDEFLVESSLKRIIVTYDVERDYKCIIEWDDSASLFKVILEPESGLSMMMSRLLNNEDGRIFNLVYSLKVSSKMILRLKSCLKERYLWTVIARNLATFRLIYQSPNFFQCYIQFSQKKMVMFTKRGIDRKICNLEDSEKVFQRYCYYVQLKIIFRRYSGKTKDKIFNMVEQDKYMLKSKKYLLHLERDQGKLRISRGNHTNQILEQLNQFLDEMVQDPYGESHKFLYDKMKSFIAFIQLEHDILSEILNSIQSFESEDSSVEILWVVPKDLNLPSAVFNSINKRVFRIGKTCLSSMTSDDGHSCVNILLRFVKKKRKRFFEYANKHNNNSGNKKRKKKKAALYHVDIPILYNMDSRDIDISWRDFLEDGSIFGKHLGLKPDNNIKKATSFKNAIKFFRSQPYEILMQID